MSSRRRRRRLEGHAEARALGALVALALALLGLPLALGALRAAALGGAGARLRERAAGLATSAGHPPAQLLHDNKWDTPRFERHDLKLEPVSSLVAERK